MSTDGRPNIVWIMCDEMRFDSLGLLSDSYVRTPNLDSLAREGVLYRNAYCASPVCSPARACWFTGLYPHTTGQMRNYGPGVRDQPGCRMHEDITTISDVLSNSGYRCGNVGVWHLGNDEHAQHGFTDWSIYRYLPKDVPDPLFTWFEQEGISNPYARDWPHKARYGTNSLPFGKIDDVRQNRTTWTIDRGIEFLDTSAGQDDPFFLLCGVKDPHPEMLVTQELLDLYPEDEVPLPDSRHDALDGKPAYHSRSKFRIPPGSLSDDKYRRMFRHYYALVTHIDNEVGRLLDRLEQNGQRENTIVLFNSDHGELLGDHGFVEKCLMYEASVRVPQILSWPAGLPAGQNVTTPVGGVDMMPTLIDLAGISLPSPIDGRSIAAALQSGDEPEGAPVFAEIASQEAIYGDSRADEHLAAHAMLLDEGWKYVWNRHDIDELYDLSIDPDEMDNLAYHPDHASRIQTMRSQISDIVQHTGPGLYHWCT